MTIGIAPRRGKPRWLAAITTVVLLGGLLAVGNITLASSIGVGISLDQCRNGGLVTNGTQTYVQCAGNGSGSSGWVNGNAGASNAHYAEAESISYRARLTGFSVGDDVQLIMQYDVIHSGKHALDYLTDKNRWQPPETSVLDTPDLPCSTVTGCDPNTVKTAAIPAPTTNLQVDPSQPLASGSCEKTGTGQTQQPVTSFNKVANVGQAQMEFFGATPADSDAIQYVGPDPNLLDTTGTEAQQISVHFTANQSNPVLAWGGHIASRLDWGCAGAPQSASGISGSPYHMAIVGMIVNGKSINFGAQDRSLSAAAVIFYNPGITTTLSSGSITVGGSVSDSATLSSATATASGQVTYTVYKDSACTMFADVGAGASLGNAGTVTVTNATVPGSDSVAFTQAGTYYWQAAYSGDNNNAAATSACTDETLVVNKATPDLSTTASGPVIVGSTITDTAHLTGGYGTLTGTISFQVYAPGDTTCATPLTPQPTSATVSGAGYYTSGTFTTTQVGTYRWRASFHDTDGNNNDIPLTACGAAGESSTVNPGTPSFSTAMKLLPNDSATISGIVSGGAVAGSKDQSITFQLFSTSNCSGTAIYSQKVTGVTADGPYPTTNTGTFVTADGTYSWLVSYSGDSYNSAYSPVCTTEQFAVDFTPLAP